MSKITPERIRELSAQARSNVETKANDEGDARATCDTRWWHPDHFDQEFARLIIQEVVDKQKLIEELFIEHGIE